MQDCLDALRFYKTRKQYKNNYQNLNEALIPKIEYLKDQVSSMEEKLQ